MSKQRTKSKIAKRAELPKEVKIVVGILEDTEYPNGEKLFNVAADNIYGTEKIPPRNYIQASIKEFKQASVDFKKNWLQRWKKNLETETAVSKFGHEAKTIEKANILTFRDPPNAPSTIKKKGFNNPLIETGLLFNSIDWKKK